MKVGVAWLTVNRSCNLSCKWCYAQEEANNTKVMSFDLARELIDILLQAGVDRYYLIGGEPTLHRDLMRIVQYLMNCNVEIVIVTNGIALSRKDFCQQFTDLKYRNIHFGISLKGSTDTDYLENCGVAAFQKVLLGISNCEKYNLPYSLSYVLTTDNVDTVDSFAQNLADLKINKYINFQICNDVILQEDFPSYSSKHPLKIDKVFAKKYEKIREILDNRIYFHQILPLCQCDKNLISIMQEQNQVSTSCHVHSRSGVIFDTDGSLLLCNHLAGFSFGKYGVDYWDYASFKEYWDSEYVVGLHSKLTTMPSIKCQSCELASKCGGGCCIQWFSKDFQSFEIYNKMHQDKEMVL